MTPDSNVFTGLNVFSATKSKERAELGETVTRWLKSNSDRSPSVGSISSAAS
jgi:hypothetical protein